MQETRQEEATEGEKEFWLDREEREKIEAEPKSDLDYMEERIERHFEELDELLNNIW